MEDICDKLTRILSDDLAESAILMIQEACITYARKMLGVSSTLPLDEIRCLQAVLGISVIRRIRCYDNGIEWKFDELMQGKGSMSQSGVLFAIPRPPSYQEDMVSDYAIPQSLFLEDILSTFPLSSFNDLSSTMLGSMSGKGIRVSSLWVSVVNYFGQHGGFDAILYQLRDRTSEATDNLCLLEVYEYMRLCCGVVALVQLGCNGALTNNLEARRVAGMFDWQQFVRLVITAVSARLLALTGTDFNIAEDYDKHRQTPAVREHLQNECRRRTRSGRTTAAGNQTHETHDTNPTQEEDPHPSATQVSTYVLHPLPTTGVPLIDHIIALLLRMAAAAGVATVNIETLIHETDTDASTDADAQAHLKKRQSSGFSFKNPNIEMEIDEFTERLLLCIAAQEVQQSDLRVRLKGIALLNDFLVRTKQRALKGKKLNTGMAASAAAVATATAAMIAETGTDTGTVSEILPTRWLTCPLLGDWIASSGLLESVILNADLTAAVSGDSLGVRGAEDERTAILFSSEPLLMFLADSDRLTDEHLEMILARAGFGRSRESEQQDDMHAHTQAQARTPTSYTCGVLQVLTDIVSRVSDDQLMIVTRAVEALRPLALGTKGTLIANTQSQCTVFVPEVTELHIALVKEACECAILNISDSDSGRGEDSSSTREEERADGGDYGLEFLWACVLLSPKMSALAAAAMAEILSLAPARRLLCTYLRKCVEYVQSFGTNANPDIARNDQSHDSFDASSIVFDLLQRIILKHLKQGPITGTGLGLSGENSGCNSDTRSIIYSARVLSQPMVVAYCVVDLFIVDAILGDISRLISTVRETLYLHYNGADQCNSHGDKPEKKSPDDFELLVATWAQHFRIRLDFLKFLAERPEELRLRSADGDLEVDDSNDGAIPMKHCYLANGIDFAIFERLWQELVSLHGALLDVSDKCGRTMPDEVFHFAADEFIDWLGDLCPGSDDDPDEDIQQTADTSSATFYSRKKKVTGSRKSKKKGRVDAKFLVQRDVVARILRDHLPSVGVSMEAELLILAAKPATAIPREELSLSLPEGPHLLLRQISTQRYYGFVKIFEFANRPILRAIETQARLSKRGRGSAVLKHFFPAVTIPTATPKSDLSPAAKRIGLDDPQTWKYAEGSADVAMAPLSTIVGWDILMELYVLSHSTCLRGREYNWSDSRNGTGADKDGDGDDDDASDASSSSSSDGGSTSADIDSISLKYIIDFLLQVGRASCIGNDADADAGNTSLAVLESYVSRCTLMIELLSRHLSVEHRHAQIVSPDDAIPFSKHVPTSLTNLLKVSIDALNSTPSTSAADSQSARYSRSVLLQVAQKALRLLACLMSSIPKKIKASTCSTLSASLEPSQGFQHTLYELLSLANNLSSTHSRNVPDTGYERELMEDIAFSAWQLLHVSPLHTSLKDEVVSHFKPNDVSENPEENAIAMHLVQENGCGFIDLRSSFAIEILLKTSLRSLLSARKLSESTGDASDSGYNAASVWLREFIVNDGEQFLLRFLSSSLVIRNHKNDAPDGGKLNTASSVIAASPEAASVRQLRSLYILNIVRLWYLCRRMREEYAGGKSEDRMRPKGGISEIASVHMALVACNYVTEPWKRRPIDDEVDSDDPPSNSALACSLIKIVFRLMEFIVTKLDSRSGSSLWINEAVKTELGRLLRRCLLSSCGRLRKCCESVVVATAQSLPETHSASFRGSVIDELTRVIPSYTVDTSTASACYSDRSHLELSLREQQRSSSYFLVLSSLLSDFEHCVLPKESLRHLLQRLCSSLKSRNAHMRELKAFLVEEGDVDSDDLSESSDEGEDEDEDQEDSDCDSDCDHGALSLLDKSQSPPPPQTWRTNAGHSVSNSYDLLDAEKVDGGKVPVQKGSSELKSRQRRSVDIYLVSALGFIQSLLESRSTYTFSSEQDCSEAEAGMSLMEYAGVQLGMVRFLFEECLFKFPALYESTETFACGNSGKAGAVTVVQSLRDSLSAVSPASTSRCKAAVSRGIAYSILLTLCGESDENNSILFQLLQSQTSSYLCGNWPTEHTETKSRQFLAQNASIHCEFSSPFSKNVDAEEILAAVSSSPDEIAEDTEHGSVATTAVVAADRGLETVLQNLSRMRNFIKKVPCGLINPGSICYMISTLQQCFMLESFREDVLALPLDPSLFRFDGGATERKQLLAKLAREFLEELQCLFANLQGSHRREVSPLPLCSVMREPFAPEQQLDISMQRDASEFISTLFGHVEIITKALGPRYDHVLKGSTAGEICNELRAAGGRISRSKEIFFFLSVAVRIGNRNSRRSGLTAYANPLKAPAVTLVESLRDFTRPEMVDYTWQSDDDEEDEDNEPVSPEGSFRKGKTIRTSLPTAKTSLLRVLPKHLFIHLKRFEFDFRAMTQVKVDDRFEFPLEIDMYEFTVEGARERRRAEAVRNGEPFVEEDEEGHFPPSSASSSARHIPNTKYNCRYQLGGVVVHCGSAHSGHYYSLIRDRDSPQDSPRWFKMNDDTVTEFDIDDLESVAFGGKKTRNAFLLVYDRIAEDASPSQEAVSSVSAEVTVTAPALSPPNVPNPGTVAESSSGRERIFSRVWSDNRSLWMRRHLLNPKYFQFMWASVSEVLSADYHSEAVDSLDDARISAATKSGLAFVFGCLLYQPDHLLSSTSPAKHPSVVEASVTVLPSSGATNSSLTSNKMSTFSIPAAVPLVKIGKEISKFVLGGGGGGGRAGGVEETEEEGDDGLDLLPVIPIGGDDAIGDLHTNSNAHLLTSRSSEPDLHNETTIACIDITNEVEIDIDAEESAILPSVSRWASLLKPQLASRIEVAQWLVRSLVGSGRSALANVMFNMNFDISVDADAHAAVGLLTCATEALARDVEENAIVDSRTASEVSVCQCHCWRCCYCACDSFAHRYVRSASAAQSLYACLKLIDVLTYPGENTFIAEHQRRRLHHSSTSTAVWINTRYFQPVMAALTISDTLRRVLINCDRKCPDQRRESGFAQGGNGRILGTLLSVFMGEDSPHPEFIGSIKIGTKRGVHGIATDHGDQEGKLDFVPAPTTNGLADHDGAAAASAVSCDWDVKGVMKAIASVVQGGSISASASTVDGNVIRWLEWGTTLRLTKEEQQMLGSAAFINRIIHQIHTHRKMAWVTVMMKLCIAGCIDPEETVESIVRCIIEHLHGGREQRELDRGQKSKKEGPFKSSHTQAGNSSDQGTYSIVPSAVMVKQAMRASMILIQVADEVLHYFDTTISDTAPTVPHEYARVLLALRKITPLLLENLTTELRVNTRKHISACQVSLEMLLRVAKHSRSAYYWLQDNWTFRISWCEDWLKVRRAGGAPTDCITTTTRPSLHPAHKEAVIAPNEDDEDDLQKPSAAMTAGSLLSALLMIKNGVDATVRAQRLLNLSSSPMSPTSMSPLSRSAAVPESPLRLLTYDSDDEPEDLIGRRVSVRWSRGQWFVGKIAGYDSSTKSHTIYYDDGEVRRHKLQECVWRLLTTV